MATVSLPHKITKTTTYSPILIIFYIIFYSPIMASSAPNISQVEALLKLKNSFTNTDSLASWVPGSEPCAKAKEWVGLVCRKGKVAGIHLAKMGLSGKIDVDALDQLPRLRTLTFENNSFTGPIPQLNRIGALKALYLHGNQFSGDIPKDYFQTMQSIKKVYLSHNKFTGEIPSSLSQLTNLMSLHLENNQFSGPIPSFEQKSLKSLDVSNNKLEGEIPPSLSKFKATSFQGNAGLCGEKLGKECVKKTVTPPTVPLPVPPTMPPPASHKEEGSSGSPGIAYGLMCASAIILGIMIAGILIMRRRQDKFELIQKEYLDDNVQMSRSSGSSKRGGSVGGSRRGSSHGGKGSGELMMINDEKGTFGLSDLMKAAAEVLGNGSLCSSYKAMMPNGFSVVVKRTQLMNKLGRDGFETEIRRFGKLKHQNILTPLAYNYKKDEKLLVFEYISKGSLLFLLHGDRGQSHADLNWPVRLKIIKGIAQGIGYLHKELSSLDVSHGDLKSSNVLLTPAYEPLLADFGFSTLVNNNQAANVLFAYKSPEVAVQHRYVSPKSDVYCLGIIILEVLTGKFPCQYLNNGKGGTDVVQWASSAIQEGREVELFDPDIASFRSGHGEMKRMLHIGAACTESNPEQRLDIREAIRRIDEIQVDGKEGVLGDRSGRRNDDDSHALDM